MQMYFSIHTINTERVSQTHRQTLRESTAALTREIVTGEYKINYEQERLLKKIAVDILVAMSLGNPINGKVNLAIIKLAIKKRIKFRLLARPRNFECIEERIVEERNCFIYCSKGRR